MQLIRGKHFSLCLTIFSDSKSIIFFWYLMLTRIDVEMFLAIHSQPNIPSARCSILYLGDPNFFLLSTLFILKWKRLERRVLDDGIIYTIYTKQNRILWIRWNHLRVGLSILFTMFRGNDFVLNFFIISK